MRHYSALSTEYRRRQHQTKCSDYCRHCMSLKFLC